MRILVLLFIFIFPTLTRAVETVKRLAAFEMGSGKTRIEVADVAFEQGNIKVKKSYYEESKSLQLSEDFQIHSNRLSSGIQEEAIRVIRDLKQNAVQFGPIDEYSGIATAVLRDALKRDKENTETFIKKIREELQVKITVIPQGDESKIGYRTGIAKVLDPKRVAAVWDSGNRSFQISDEDHSYEGDLGASLVLQMMVEDVQKKKYSKNATANPSSLLQLNTLRKTIQSRLKPVPAWLQKKLEASPETMVLGMGDPDSLFAFGKIATQKTILKRDEIWKAAQRFAPLTDSELRKIGYNDPARAVVSLVFLHAVMEHLDIHAVQFVPTLSNTKGILLTPEYWQVWQKS